MLSLLTSDLGWQIPNFNSLTIVSLLAALMSLSYSTIAIGASIAAGRQADAYYNLDTKSVADQVFGKEPSSHDWLVIILRLPLLI